jgi:uncharacterized oligopeptide transporter (OPT) family protein
LFSIKRGMDTPEESGNTGFTLRAVAVAVVLAVFLAASSIYVSLSVGAMPWPIIISVIASGFLLKLLGKTNIHEINVAQAGASIGGVLASAAAFTIPAIWFLQNKGVEVEPLPTITIIAVCITAGILGLFLAVPTRRVFIDEEKLPYASGKAGAEVLIAGDEGGKKAIVLLLAGALAGLFMALTYFFSFSVVSLNELAGMGVILAVALFIAPLAAGIGYILGPKISINSWFGGSLVGWGILIPVLFSQGTSLDSAIGIVQNLGMGILLGSGVSFLFLYVAPNYKKIFFPMFSGGPWYVRGALPFSIAAVGVLFAVGVPILAAVLAVAGVFVVAGVAARMTGETDIDPYEQFGIVAVVTIGMLFGFLNMNLGYAASFIIVSFVTIAAAVVGDIGFDFKSAKIIGTRAVDMLKVDIAAVVFAGIATPFVLEIVKKSYASDLFTSSMPATQSTLVAGSISGFAHPEVFLIGFAFAAIWEILRVKVFGGKSPISAMAFGIGMFIGFALSIPFAVGGAARLIVEKKKPELVETGMLAAAGVMGGVGIAGFARGGMIIFGFASMADSLIAAFFGVLLVVGVWMWKK